jgi:hypothetical protein
LFQPSKFWVHCITSSQWTCQFNDLLLLSLLSCLEEKYFSVVGMHGQKKVQTVTYIEPVAKLYSHNADGIPISITIYLKGRPLFYNQSAYQMKPHL